MTTATRKRWMLVIVGSLGSASPTRSFLPLYLAVVLDLFSRRVVG